jgi:uncharacterized membrane protein YvbJ
MKCPKCNTENKDVSRNCKKCGSQDTRLIRELKQGENMTEQTLFKQTLELAKLTRNAIIYLLQFVYVEEKIRMTRLKGIAVPMFAREIPDNLKSYR